MCVTKQQGVNCITVRNWEDLNTGAITATTLALRHSITSHHFLQHHSCSYAKVTVSHRHDFMIYLLSNLRKQYCLIHSNLHHHI